jgi:arginine deiminase
VKNILNVTSEIGRLKKVVIHEPGMELEHLTPRMLEQLLFDDIPWLNKAIEEHKCFAEIYKSHGVEVLYLTKLVQETLDSNDLIKQMFISQFLKEANVQSETLLEVLTAYLKSFSDTEAMVKITMAGIKKAEVPGFVRRTLSDYIRDYPFVTDPMPNLYFTRDPFSIIGNGVVISTMFTQTRSRETIYGDYIFKYHPVYGNKLDIYYERDFPSTIEGGDILTLSKSILAIGVSQRTHPKAIENLAKILFYKYNTTFNTILAVDIPKVRSFMHLDTVFTQVDHDKFTTHAELQKTLRVFELTKDKVRLNKIAIKEIEKPLGVLLEHYLQKKITLIHCGGSDPVAGDREQWNDGANCMAIAPGEVIVYERNHITNNLLINNNIKINAMPSSELSRGRGGPRCMSMPLEREDI